MKEEIVRLVTTHPFKGFGIHLPSGQIILVDRPERVAISPKRDEVVVFSEDGNYHFINVAQITDLGVV